MKDEFSKHRCPGQECRRLMEAAEKPVSCSFLCLGFVVSQSVIVSRTACLFCGAECIVFVVVVCVIKITCPHCSQYFCNNNNNNSYYYYCYYYYRLRIACARSPSSSRLFLGWCDDVMDSARDFRSAKRIGAAGSSLGTYICPLGICATKLR